MAELTPNLQLVKPTINGEDTENTWGYDLNSNFDILDDAVVQSRVSDGDKGDIIVSAQGELWKFDPTVVTAAGRGVIAVDAQAGLLEQNGATAFRKRGITVAQQPPSGGVDGDLWLQYNLALPPEVNWDVSSSFFNTRTEAAASDIPNTVLAAQTGGFDQPGDQRHALYARMNVVPPLPLDPLLYFRSVDRNKLDGGQDPVTGGYWKRVDTTNNVFDTKADAEAVTLPAATKTLLLNGYATVGDAQQTMICRRVNAMPTLHDGYIRTLDRYKADGTIDATNGGYWEYIVPAEGIRVEWFGAKADDVTDCLGPFNKAVKMASSRFDANFKYYRGGPCILFGFCEMSPEDNSRYRFSGPLNPDRTVHIKGAHAGGVSTNSGNPTLLGFPVGSKGCIIRFYIDTGVGSTATPGAVGTVLEDLFFRCDGPGGFTTAHGLEMRGQATVRNCRFDNFGGDGLNITGQTPGSSVNLYYLDNVWATSNAGNGFYVDGADANGGTAIMCSSIGNLGWGFYDSSFLGNTWIGCHSRSNTLGGYKADDPNAVSLFLGCYSEYDEPESRVNTPSMCVGGLLGFRNSSGTGASFHSRTQTAFGIRPIPGTTSEALIGIGADNNGQPSPNLVFSIGGIDTSGVGQSLSYNNFYKDITWDYFGGTTYRITTNQTTITAGRSAPLARGRIGFDAGIWIAGGLYGDVGVGNPAYLRWLGNDVTPPAIGQWAQGDRIFHREPGPGSIEGWVCTTSGTAGSGAVFKTFGLVGALERFEELEAKVADLTARLGA